MALKEQDLKSLIGLSEAEAAAQLLKHGPNELPSGRRKSVFSIALEVVKEPMFLLLVSCGTLYLLMGDLQEALMLLGFVFVVMGITIYQETKTEKALDALRDLSSPRALVIRDGRQLRIAGREVVPGDHLILAEGDRVPADAALIWASSLSCDESLLTGESVAVRKSAGELDTPLVRPGGDDIPFVYSGTLVVQGQGVAVVKGTGIATEIGKIGKALQELTEENTLLQRDTAKLVRAIFTVAVGLCAVVVVLYGLTRGDWIKGILTGLTLAMAMLPEEFPVVLTIFLALGAWRMSKHQVLTRRAAAIETLGAATVLCSDKTGTLTENRMTIRRLWVEEGAIEVSDGEGAELPEAYHGLIEYGILASNRDPFDPMEKAFLQLGRVRLAGTEHLHTSWNMVKEYPLSRDLLALSHVWQAADEEGYVVGAKGAPEAVLDLCHASQDVVDRVLEQVGSMARDGLRVLGVARARLPVEDDLPIGQHDIQFAFIGLVGLEDPVRESVPGAVAQCYEAGIRVVMITGDYPATAQNIARRIGLRNADAVITGPELEALPAAELAQRVRNTDIFARVVPEQKLRLVEALKANGEVVAMTGDGVNDAPALKAAHIGVAMGGRGTDVAREAAALVLLDDSFPSIVQAVRMGRRIFENLKKAMAYIVSVHIPIAGMTLLPVIFRWDEVLFPVHIVFLELVIDPACSVVFEAEPEEEGAMRRPPRPAGEHLIGGRMLLISVLQGLFALAAVLLVFLLSVQAGYSAEEARTAAFLTLVVSNLSLILVNRTWRSSILHSILRPNRALIWVTGGATLFLGLVLTVPFLQGLFYFAPLHGHDLLLAAGAGLGSILWFEGVKWVAKVKHIDLLKG